MNGPRYNAAVTERFSRPALPLPSAVAGSLLISGTAGSERDGATVRFFALLQQDSLSEVGFRACACPHIIAACSLVAERLQGRPPADLCQAELTGGLQELEIPVEKMGKILILQDALRACWEDLQARPSGRVSA